jgi:hypothetical protein
MILSDFKDKHKGKMAFCLGAGPSLRHIDKNLLNNHIVFSVNSSISKFKNSQYYVCDDYSVKYWNYFQDLNKRKCINFFYKQKLKNQCNHINKDKIVWFDHRFYQDPVDGHIKPDSLKVSDDPTFPLIGARTALATAINIAYIMGCSPIVLLGADCCLEEGKRYFWEFEGESKNKSLLYDRNHEYNTINGVQLDKHSKSFMKYWEDFKKSNPNIDIINASGGILDIFTRKNIMDLINE